MLVGCAGEGEVYGCVGGVCEGDLGCVGGVWRWQV